MRFELPTTQIRPAVERLARVIPTNVTDSLTDAGHTAVGFAALAGKKLNDNRLELNGRFEPQVREARKSALAAAKSVRETRVRVQETVDPIVDRVIERLPETIADTTSETVAELRKTTRQFATQADRKVVELIEFATAVPTKAVRRPAAAASAKTASAKTASAKAAPATKRTAKPAAKKVAKTTQKSTVRKASAQKSVKTAVRKPAARRAA
jgi:hypothetical protein